MLFDREKLSWLWEQSSRYSTLFTDLTRGNEENFVNLVTAPNTYWMEIWEGDEVIGLFYLTDIQPAVDCTMHILFFDRKPAEKFDLCQAAMAYVARKFYFHRMSAQVPAIYHATIRLVERLGLTLEGRRTEVYLMGGNWIDELMYGILASEIKNGR